MQKEYRWYVSLDEVGGSECVDGACGGAWADAFAAHQLGGWENLAQARARGYTPGMGNTYDIATLRTLGQLGELFEENPTDATFPDEFILRAARAASVAIPENKADFERLGLNLTHVLKGIDITLTPSSHRSP